MKVLFISPPYHAGVVEVAGRWVPLYFVYLAGALRTAGHEPVIYDAMTKFVGYDEIEASIRKQKPDMVCTTAITCTSPDAIKVMELAKKIDPDITTVCGGVHASFMYEEMFSLTDAMDYVVIGEGEETIKELAGSLEAGQEPENVAGLAYRKDGKTVVTPKRPFCDNLDNMPTAFDLLDWEDYTYFIVPGSRLGAIATSRGCDKDCTFCSQQKFWEQTWRARSPEDLLREVEEQHTKYGVDIILLTDEYPTPDARRWEDFLDLLIEKALPMQFLMETRVEDIIRDKEILWKYRKAGIIHIYVGIESTEDSDLETLKKGISSDQAKLALKLMKEAGIITETSMILGFPDDTKESIEQTIKLIREYDPDFAHFLAIAPWPYSDLYKELEPYIVERDYRKYNLIDPIVKPKNMTLEDIDIQIINGYRDFYMNKFMQMEESDDEFRKEYIMRAMKRMMSDSFIKKKLGMLAEMPEEIKKIMESKMD